MVYLPEMVWYGGGRGINATYELLKKKKKEFVSKPSVQSFTSHTTMSPKHRGLIN